MSSQPLRLTIVQASQSMLRLEGEIDLHTAEELEAGLAAIDATGETVLDLSGVSFVDSSGLRVMIQAHQLRQGAGGRLVLANPSEVVVKLLEITGLLDRLDVHVDEP